MSVKPIPEGYHAITPYLITKNASAALDFYVKAFGAELIDRMDGPDGQVMHAEFQIGDSRMMIADECPEMNAFAPPNPGRSGVGLCLYVENVDEVVANAIEAGASVERPLQDQFYGDRSATLHDPFGHLWTVATHIEDVSPEEMKRRMEEVMQQGAEPS